MRCGSESRVSAASRAQAAAGRRPRSRPILQPIIVMRLFGAALEGAPTALRATEKRTVSRATGAVWKLHDLLQCHIAEFRQPRPIRLVQALQHSYEPRCHRDWCRRLGCFKTAPDVPRAEQTNVHCRSHFTSSLPAVRESLRRLLVRRLLVRRLLVRREIQDRRTNPPRIEERG